MMPPDRNDHTTIHAADRAGNGRGQREVVEQIAEILEHGAEADDRRHERLSEIPIAWDRYSCHQPRSTLSHRPDEARVELRRQHAPERDGQRQRDEERDEERARQQRRRARGTTQTFPERSRRSHGQTKKP